MEGKTSANCATVRGGASNGGVSASSTSSMSFVGNSAGAKLAALPAMIARVQVSCDSTAVYVQEIPGTVVPWVSQ